MVTGEGREKPASDFVDRSSWVRGSVGKFKLVGSQSRIRWPEERGLVVPWARADLVAGSPWTREPMPAGWQPASDLMARLSWDRDA